MEYELKINNGDKVDAVDLIQYFTVPNDESFAPYLTEIFKVNIIIHYVRI